jgi:GT2 family glycosyltransferase
MKFGAVYCLYDDHEYLDISLEPIKNKLDKVLFLISDVPWNGKKSDNSSTIEKVKKLCLENRNFELVQGHWKNEIEQRNYGLQVFYDNGIDIYFVIDSDEIYHSNQFDNIIRFIEQNTRFAAFHLEWNTYWKKDYYVISPREYYKPLIAVRVNSFLFTTIRHGTTNVIRTSKTILKTQETNYNYALIPPEIAICYHLSYARTDEFIRRKLETNSHAPEFIQDWYERVWKNWKPSDKNLHPVTPQQYTTAIKENFAAFPDSLKTFIKKERKRNCSIIILNWNCWDLTLRCLNLINENTKNINYEIVLVDNGSVQNVEEIKAYTAPNLVKVLNESNLGFAGGVNSGIKASKSKNDIVLINADAEPDKDWLENLYNTLEGVPNCGIVGPLGNNIPNGYQKEGMIDRDAIVFNLHFYCCLIYRKVIEKIGLFDTQFKIGGYEDNDFCIRSNLAGFVCCISAKSLVIHQPHQVFLKNKVDFGKIELENRRLLQEKLINAFYNYTSVIDYMSFLEIAKETGLYIDDKSI